MYEKFYGLKESPFNLTPDSSFLYLNKRSKEAIDLILYAIYRREGFSLIVGDIGTGKTTLCWALLEKLAREDIRTALIQNPMLSDTDIVRSILQDLGVRQGKNPPDADAAEMDASLDIFDTDWMQALNKKQLIDRLNQFLAARAQEDVFTVLIIDEAQNLSQTMLEQLRLFSNFETAKKKLLQIVFVGQLELDRKLKLTSMRQLDQRISVRFETKTLSKADTENYIRHRLAIAGAPSRLRFGSGAFRAVWRYSKGYPRLINMICDRALLNGYINRTSVISRNLVRRAAMGLKGEDRGPRFAPGWLRRMAPYVFPAIILLVFLCFMVYRALAH